MLFQLVIALLYLLASNVRAQIPFVQLPYGAVEGFLGTSFNGRTFFQFEGVPYASAPVGQNRFKEPQPPQPWNGTLYANNTIECLQLTRPAGIVKGEEDCLHLNIYTPSLNQNASFDVIVYIHGGAFMYGSGSVYGPQLLLDKNVVLVTINYRVGPLGFLSTESEIVPGNNGIKDQIFALQWIQNNVKYFGGNPNSVTIAGTSAGGASVHLHYLTPKSKGLFHKGISQSGVILNPWVIMEAPLDKTKKLASMLDCPTGNIVILVSCLRSKPARDIVDLIREFQPWLASPFSPWGVVVDGHWSSNPVLPDHPYNLIKNKEVAFVPWIVSYTKDEGLFPGYTFYNDTILQDIDKRWNEILPLILHYNYTVKPKLKDTVGQAIRQYYLQDKEVTKANFADFLKILTDRIFVVDIHKTVQLQASATYPIYLYKFSYQSNNSWVLAHTEYKSFGVSHMEDVAYIFNVERVFRTMNTTAKTEDRRIVELMVEMFVSFAKTGRPNVTRAWLPVQKHSLDFLEIVSSTNLTIGTITNFESEAFWNSLPLAENEKLLGVNSGVKLLFSCIFVLLFLLHFIIN